MDFDEQKPTWDSLTKELGIEPAPEAFQRHQPPPQDLPAAAPQADAGEVEEPPTSPPGNWKDLAEDLGVAVDPEHFAGAPESDTPAEPELPEPVTLPAPIFSSDSVATVQHASAAEAHHVANSEDTQQAFAEYSDVGDSPSPPTAALPRDAGADDTLACSSPPDEAATGEAPATDAVLPEPTEEGLEDKDKNILDKTSDVARSAFDALFSIGASAWGSAVRESPEQGSPFEGEPRELFAEDKDQGDVSADISGTEADGTDLEEGAVEMSAAEERRPRRRRRRGGRRRKATGDSARSDETATDVTSAFEDGAESVAEEADEKRTRPRRSRRRSRGAAEPRAAARSPQDPQDSLDPVTDSEDVIDASTAEVGEGKRRTSHRNLPTWSDAIGVIVDANLELHKTSSSRSGGSRGRGGRGRGGRQRGSGGQKK